VAVLAGVLVLGIGIGTAVSSNTAGNQGNIASSQQLDMAVPDPEFCKQWGASAFVMDIELYTTMNPSSSFVTQPTLQPGCVIRPRQADRALRLPDGHQRQQVPDPRRGRSC
jgi:hypothetical protein